MIKNFPIIPKTTSYLDLDLNKIQEIKNIHTLPQILLIKSNKLKKIT